ncbi:MAG: 5-formyltetrahydrofolate cyclo-ligase [Promicromonosporaceae bacterium]|nr:5-formyltetrahydrofolate cyclo-ligase [Promicromonosporaceae bacterium]
MTGDGRLLHPDFTTDDADAVIEAKDALRHSLRDRRATHTAKQRMATATVLADVLDSIPAVREATCLAAYAARSNEPDTSVWLERAISRGQRVLLPMLGSGLARDWAECTSVADLCERAPGRPPEPPGPALGAEAVASANVVIAPALAIDTRGRRLGQGGGWFDRMLALVPRGVPVIGLVFDEELYDGDANPLPVEPHDLPVNAVATPSGWRSI